MREAEFGFILRWCNPEPGHRECSKEEAIIIYDHLGARPIELKLQMPFVWCAWVPCCAFEAGLPAEGGTACLIQCYTLTQEQYWAAMPILSHDCIWSSRQAPGCGFSHPSHSDVQHGCILSHFSSVYTELAGLGREMGREIAVLLSPWRTCCLQFSELQEADRSLWCYDTISKLLLDVTSLFVGLVDTPCELILYLNMESHLRADGYS